ncbi:unnamed protein product [Blepharisma stoltei]|uniref:Uncharacterized protein n=1 Tax=Blepharisma stoltei TaxID=1481888 RepID=A0AAU9IRK1_9CILI|nr:unnamed protein product [Blepharisma stoltei]
MYFCHLPFRNCLSKNFRLAAGLTTHKFAQTFQTRRFATELISQVARKQLNSFINTLLDPQFSDHHLRKYLRTEDMRWCNEYCMGMVLTSMLKKKDPYISLLNYFEERILFMNLTDSIACSNLIKLFSKLDYVLTEEALLKLVDAVLHIKDEADSSKHISLFLFSIAKSHLTFLQKMTIFTKFEDLVVSRKYTFNSDDRGQLIFAFSKIITERSSDLLYFLINNTPFIEKSPEEILSILDAIQFTAVQNDHIILEKTEKFYIKYHPFLERVEYIKVVHSFSKRNYGSKELWEILQDCFFWFDYDDHSLGVVYSSFVRTNKTSDQFLRQIWPLIEERIGNFIEKHRGSIIYFMKKRNITSDQSYKDPQKTRATNDKNLVENEETEK